MSAETQTYDIKGKGLVVVEATSGNVEVKGWDKPQVAIETSRGSAQVREEESTLRIRSGLSGSEDIELRVPHQCDLTLYLVSGDAKLKGIAGKIDVQSMSGDIKAEKVSGAVKAHSISGDIILRESALHNLAVDTVSGDCVIESALDIEGSYRSSSVSGDIRLLIPEDQRCTAHMQSLSGEFKCSLPHQVEQQGWGKLTAQINGGGVEIYVRSASGSLSIKAAEKVAESAAPEPFQSPPQPEPAEPFAGERSTKPLAETPPPAPTHEPFSLGESGTAESAPQNTAQRRMEILKAIEEGRLSVGEGLARLRELE